MPAGITIVGLGPGGSQYWTQAALDLLQQTGEVYLRTAVHPGVADIRARTYAFDDWDNRAETLDEAADRVAAEIVRLGGRAEGVIYAVPGDGSIGEATVPRIRRLAAAAGLPVRLIPGLGFLEPTLAVLGVDALHLQLVDGAEVARLHHPPLAPDRPALLMRVYGQEMLSRLKKVLLNAYPEQLAVTLVQAAGSPAEQVWSGSLAELDRQPELQALAVLYLPGEAANASFPTLQETIAHLRAPEGCPWDREQTHQSLRPFLLEETYEVLEALDAGDLPALAEELGDLLLQIVLHAQVAADGGEFRMGQVIHAINRKLLRRHPHVFGDVVVNGVKDVITNWEAIKKMEKAENNGSRAAAASQEVPSVLDGVPKALPALAQALSISKRAVRVGFEWATIDGVLDQLVEEAREIVEAVDPAQVEAEIGDWLFSAVNLARWRHVDPESALRAANARFMQRFRQVEALAAARGTSLADMSIEEMETLWDEAKQIINAAGS